MMDNEEKRRHLFMQIQMLCAGEDAHVVLAALKDSLSSVVGFISTDDDDADLLIRETVQQLQASVEMNWDATREMRTHSPQFSKTQQ